MKISTPNVTGSLRSTTNNIIGVVRSNDLNPQLHNQLTSAGNKCDVIRFDNEILSSNPNWRNKCNEDQIQTERYYTMDTSVKSNEYLGNLNTTMAMQAKEKINPESNEWAHYNASEFQKELDPLKYQSESRLNNFCDYIGVTDRYRGYKQNFANPGTTSMKVAPKTGKCCSFLETRKPQRFNLKYPNPPTLISPYILSTKQNGQTGQNDQQLYSSEEIDYSNNVNDEEDEEWKTDEDEGTGTTEYIDSYKRPPIEGLGKFIMSPEGDEEYTLSGLDRHDRQPPLDNTEYTDMYAKFKERPYRLNISRSKATDNEIPTKEC